MFYVRVIVPIANLVYLTCTKYHNVDGVDV